MTTKKQIQAAKRNIKKAQRVWDRMHKSVAEGYPPEKLASGGEIFKLQSKTTKRHIAITRANALRRKGFKVRVKPLDVGEKRTYLIYVGPKRKKTAHIPAGKGPKGHYHKSYTRHLPTWSGYGKREKPGRGRGR